MSMASIVNEAVRRVKPRRYWLEEVSRWAWSASQKERIGVDATILLGQRHNQLSLGKFEFHLNLPALTGVESVLEFCPQFLDVLFDGHRRCLLMFEKDDTGIREGEAGSGIAPATAGGGAWGSRNASVFWGYRASLRPPCLSDTIGSI